MKVLLHFVFIIAFVLIAGASVIAQPYYFRSKANTNWNVYTTWDRSNDGITYTASPTGAVAGTNFPGANDFVIINSTVAVNVASSCKGLRVNAGRTLNIGGVNFTVSDTVKVYGTFTDPNNGGTNTMSGAVTIYSGGTLNTQNDDWDFGSTIDVFGTLTDSKNDGSQDVVGAVTVHSGGTLNTQNDVWNFNQLVTVDGTLNDSNNDGINSFNGGLVLNNTSPNITTTSAWNMRSQFTLNGTATFTKTGDADFTFTANTTIGGSSTGNIYLGNGNNEVIVANSVTVTNNYQGKIILVQELQAGGANAQWIQGTGSHIEVRYTAAPMNAGILDASTNVNTVEYSADANQTLKGVTYHHLILSNFNAASGTNRSKNFVAGMGTINGDFTITDRVSCNVNVNTNISGNVTITTTSTGNPAIAFNTTGTALTHQIDGKLVLNSGIVFVQYNNTTNVLDNLTIDDSLVINGGTFVLTNQAHDATVIVNGHFRQNAGTLTLGSANNSGRIGTLEVKGNFSQLGGTISNAGTNQTNRIILNGTLQQTLTGGGTINTNVGVIFETLNANGFILASDFIIPRWNANQGVVDANGFVFGISETDSASLVATSPLSLTNGVEGNFRRTVTDAKTYLYPLIKNGVYNELSLATSSSGNSGTLDFEFFDANTGGSAALPLGSLLNNNMYWRGISSASAIGALTISPIPGLVFGNGLGFSSTLAGAYSLAGGSVSGTTLSSASVSLGTTETFFTLGVVAPISGTYTVGATGTLTKLTTVAAWLNSSTVTGNATFEMLADYDGTTGETFPITFNQFATTGGAHSVTIRPAVGVGAIETSNSNVGTAACQIVFNGVDRLTFDGRAGGVGSARAWKFVNGNNLQYTFRLANSSDSVKLSYIDISSQNRSISSTTEGVVRIESGAIDDGCDFVTIDNCRIYSENIGKTVRWARGIVYQWTGSGLGVNEDNFITNNDFENIMLGGGSGAPANNTAGIYASGGTVPIGDNVRVTRLTIEGNSFFQSVEEAYHNASGRGITNFLLLLNPSKFYVRNNYFGGSATKRGGTPLKILYSPSEDEFHNLRCITITRTGTYTNDSAVVTGNIFQNIDIETNTFGNYSEPMLQGIICWAGTVDVSNNEIGDPTGVMPFTFKVKREGTGRRGTVSFFGIDLGGAQANGQVVNNTISRIVLTHETLNDSLTMRFVGINNSSTAAFSLIKDNTINEIFTTITDNQMVMQQVGINHSTAFDCVIEGNTVGNFYSNNSGVTYSANVANGPSGPGTYLFSPETAGIIINTSSTASLSFLRNKVYNFESDVDGLQVSAIRIEGLGSGLNLFANNMITMGYGKTSNIQFNGVHVKNTIADSVHLIYNTIVITGPGYSGSSPKKSSYCVYREGASNTTGMFLRNNIIYNERLQHGTERHLTYATDNTTNWSSNNSVFYAGDQSVPSVASDTLALWGSDYITDLADWKLTTSQDAVSIVGPMFYFDISNGNLTPLGTNFCDLYANISDEITIANGYLYDITNDHFLVSRATPPAPGAVEYNFIGYWNGVNSSDWFDPANWCGGVVPNANITAYVVDFFDPTPPFFPIINSGTAICKDLIVTNAIGTHLGTPAVCPASVVCNYPGLTGGPWSDGDPLPFTNRTAKVTVNAGGTLRVHGDLLIHDIYKTDTIGMGDSCFFHNGGTVEFAGTIAANGSLQNIPGYARYKNVTISGDNSKLLQGHATIDSLLFINSGLLFSMNSYDLDLNGTIGGLGEIGGSQTSRLSVGGLNGAFGTIYMRNIGLGNVLDSFIVTRSGTSPTVTMGSDIYIDSLFQVTDATINDGGNVIYVRKNAVLANPSSEHIGSGSITFRNTDAATTYTATGAGHFGNVVLNDGNGLTNTVTLGSEFTCNNFSILDGTWLASGNKMNIEGNWLQFTGANSIFTHGNNEVEFNGSSLQTITGNTPFYNLTFNNAADFTLLGSSVPTFANEVKFQDGVVTTAGTSVLTGLPGVTVSGGSVASHVNGRMAHQVNTASVESRFYATGKNGQYRPVYLDVTQATTDLNTYTNEQFEASGTTLGGYSNSTGLFLSPARYYHITRTPNTGAFSATVGLSYATDEYTAAGSADMTILKTVGSAWTDMATQAAPADPGAGLLVKTSNPFNSFSEFAISYTNVPLSLNLLQFNALTNGTDVALDWSAVVTERSGSFILERSTNGIDFVAVYKTQSEVNTKRYGYTDLKAFAANNTTSLWYRLRLINQDGNESISPVRVVSTETNSKSVFNLFPNPASDVVYLDVANLQQSQTLNISFIDVAGKSVHRALVPVAKGSSFVKLDTYMLSKGVYMVQLLSDAGLNQTLRLVIEK